MQQKRSEKQRLYEFAKQSGILRVRDVATMGIHPENLRRLAAEGVLTRGARGVYYLADADITEHHTLAEVCKRVPGGVICLLSALRFHELTTQSPWDVWLAIDRKARKPRLEYPALRIARFSGSALTEGVEAHRIEGVTVKVFSPAKTVVDCFKYRNKIGLDVALEATKDYLRAHRGGMDNLWRFAKICRVANVMRPYLEAI
jgi:predicted transcriptional regulator of viral defense system